MALEFPRPYVTFPWKLSKLRHLVLHDNKLEGGIPTVLHRLPSLRNLSL